MTMTRSDLYRDLKYTPDFDRRKYESRFVERAPKPGATFSNFDAHLGWDVDIQGDRIRGGLTYSRDPDPGTLRILTIGDSFTYGVGVADNETFSHFLETYLCNSEVLNMGVPGYGIDQAFWKYHAYGSHYKPNILVFGIYSGDYKRTTLSFTSFSKPYYAGDTDGTFAVLNRPVPHPLDELERIRDEARLEIYVVALLRNTFYRIRGRFGGDEKFLVHADSVIRNILTSLRDHLASERITGGERWHDLVGGRLTRLYHELGIPYLDLEKEFLVRHEPMSIYQSLYIHHADGSVGHLSTLGHEETGRIIAEKLDFMSDRAIITPCRKAPIGDGEK
jgi:hypothetical protein